MDTETLDKLYLEWSQFTTARTHREIRMAALLLEAATQFKDRLPVSWQNRVTLALKKEQIEVNG
jgi:hypothetical protein